MGHWGPARHPYRLLRSVVILTLRAQRASAWRLLSLVTSQTVDAGS
jgi:hypothetical protein